MTVRSILSANQNNIYLTFDDGPSVVSTSEVLDLLARLQVPATFFLIAETARAEGALVERIRLAGHGVGNHSLNHGYRQFFLPSKKPMRDWVKHSEEIFAAMGISTIGFRPPAGVRNPQLHAVLRELGIPLVLWNKRFFDTVLRWTPQIARISLKTLKPGSIILLHDRQRPSRLADFLDTLEYFIKEARAKGFEFQPLTRELCLRQ